MCSPSAAEDSPTLRTARAWGDPRYDTGPSGRSSDPSIWSQPSTPSLPPYVASLICTRPACWPALRSRNTAEKLVGWVLDPHGRLGPRRALDAAVNSRTCGGAESPPRAPVAHHDKQLVGWIDIRFRFCPEHLTAPWYLSGMNRRRRSRSGIGSSARRDRQGGSHHGWPVRRGHRPPMLPGDINSVAMGVNACGHAVGRSYVNNLYRATAWVISACD